PMSRRFQFSLRRMLGSVALLCVAAVCWRLSFLTDATDLFPRFAFVGFATAVFAAVWALTDRPIAIAIPAMWAMVALRIAVEFLERHRP
ncbi:MAG: hypothetical protein ACREHD_26795, partial [Pirellulales bacterium]